jgi:hypothetical protein
MAGQALPSTEIGGDTAPAQRPAGWRGTLKQWGRSLRGFADPSARQTLGEWYGKLPPSTATVNLQVWGGVAIWRITAGWVMVAAIIAAGGLAQLSTLDFARIVLLWLLVDPLWGALWRMAGGRNHLLSLRTGDDQTPTTETLRLPYVTENSPAGQLLSLDESNAIPWLVRIALPTTVVALVVASVLGLWAVLLTLFMVVVAAAGWTWRRTLHLPPLAFHAVALALLPWLLALPELGIAPGSERWGLLLALGILWMLHAWAHPSLRRSSLLLKSALGCSWSLTRRRCLSLLWRFSFCPAGCGYCARSRSQESRYGGWRRYW